MPFQLSVAPLLFSGGFVLLAEAILLVFRLLTHRRRHEETVFLAVLMTVNFCLGTVLFVSSFLVDLY